jgi:hypothetical protein
MFSQAHSARFEAINSKGTKSTRTKCSIVPIQKRSYMTVFTRLFSSIISILDQKYCPILRNSQKLSTRDGMKFFKKNPTCRCLIILFYEFTPFHVNLLMIQCKQKLFEFGSSVRKYVLGFGFMHYKTQVPSDNFGASAGELAKNFEYIWKSRNVSLLIARPTSAEID